MTGLITWHELFTDDVEAAKRFYPELLGVELETADMGDFQYSMLKKDGRTHAGFVVKPEEGGDAPNHWYPYIQVDDVDAALAKAAELGSETYMGPIEPAEGLRIGVIGDPQHATFGVMSWNEEAPTGLFVWDELHATDTAAAAAFYGDLVGWTTEPFERTGLRRYSPTGRGPRTTCTVTGPCAVNCTLRSYVAPGNSGIGCAPAGAAKNAASSAARAATTTRRRGTARRG